MHAHRKCCLGWSRTFLLGGFILLLQSCGGIRTLQDAVHSSVVPELESAPYYSSEHYDIEPLKARLGAVGHTPRPSNNQQFGNKHGDKKPVKGTVIVSSPWELRGAVESEDVSDILVAKDLKLRWYNGWGASSLYSGAGLYRSTDLSIRTAPGRDPAVLDFDGVQLLGSMFLPDSITLNFSRLVLENVAPIQKEALPRDLSKSTLVVHDSIVHFKASGMLLDGVLWDTRQHPEKYKGITTLGSGQCSFGEHNVPCLNGGWEIDSWVEDVGRGGQDETGRIVVEHSLITVEKFDYRYVSTPSQLAKYMGNGHDERVFFGPTVQHFAMENTTFCPGTGLRPRQNMTLHAEMSVYSAIFLDFNQTQDCLHIPPFTRFHLRDVVLEENAQGGQLDTLIPFFVLEHGSTLQLEAVVVPVIPPSNKYTLATLELELHGLSEGLEGANITRTSLRNFYQGGRRHEAFREPDAPGLIVSNLTIPGASEGSYELEYCFFMIDDSFYTGGRGRAALGIVSAAVLVAVSMVILGIVLVKRSWRRLASGKGGSCDRLGQDRFVCNEELTLLSRSTDEMLHQEHQAVAEKLLEALTLGRLIGRGSFGQVYKATWNGAPVAVKVIFHRSSELSNDESIAREASLSSHLRHPNVVQTFMQATRTLTQAIDGKVSKTKADGPGNPYIDINDLCGKENRNERHKGIRGIANANDSIIDSAAEAQPLLSEASSLGPSIQQKETWLVQEFCDLGSLGQGIELGLLKGDGGSNMVSVLPTCADIARGMQHLHSQNVIHGDLKCTNVLLCSSAQDPRGFTARVADFGLSRQMGMDVTHISTNTIGTLTHMPPELLKGRKLVPKADVYSFGIMMWEILMGKSPFEGWTAPQLLRAVVTNNWRPSFPHNVPKGFVDLAQQCWNENADARPGFDEILKHLGALKNLLDGSGNVRS